MNILFMSLADFDTITCNHICTDLLREFRKHGHKLYIISPVEKRENQRSYLIKETDTVIIKLRTGNIQKANTIEKGISTVMIGYSFIYAIRKYFSKVRFDLVLYQTPPVTVSEAVKFIKKRDGARTYLLLKDIFPQNAVDMGMLDRSGVKGIIYRYFRKKEKELYETSDYIGCTSQAAIEYIHKHNPEINRDRLEICANSVEPRDKSISCDERRAIRHRYQIPQEKTVFIYGGNLGKPQGIDFLLKCVHSQRKNIKVFFLVIGNGTEYRRIQQYVETYRPQNVMLHRWMPKEEYEKVMAACDVGLIFLDHRFTIPNFPCRLLSYMSAKLPVLAVTDTATDIGEVITENHFGWWCKSDSVKGFDLIISRILQENNEEIKENSFLYLQSCYSAYNSYLSIKNHAETDKLMQKSVRESKKKFKG